MTEESDSLPDQVIEALTAMGFWCQRIFCGTVRVGQKFRNLGAAGTPQVLVLAPVYGWLYARRTHGLTGNQVTWYSQARDRGVPVHIVHSVDEARRVVFRWDEDRRLMLEPKSLELTE